MAGLSQLLLGHESEFLVARCLVLCPTKLLAIHYLSVDDIASVYP